MVNRPKPQWLNHVFKSKHTSEHETENRGKHPRRSNDSGQRRLLEMVNKRSYNHQQKPLPHIPEHDTKNERVCESYKQGRVHFIVSRQTVHSDKHLKRLKQLGIFQLCRRLSEITVVIVFHHNKDFIVLFSLCHELFHIVLRHPSAKNIVILLLVLYPGRHLAYVKVVGQFFQPLLCPYKLRRFLFKHSRSLFIDLFYLLLNIVHLFQKLLACLLRGSLILCRDLYPLKMQGTKHCVRFLKMIWRGKICAIDKLFILHTLYKDGVQFSQKIFLQFLILLLRHLTKPVRNVFIMQHLA